MAGNMRCSICGVDVKGRKKMRGHVRRVHSDSCPVCSAILPKKSIDKHLRKVHAVQDPNCEQEIVRTKMSEVEKCAKESETRRGLRIQRSLRELATSVLIDQAKRGNSLALKHLKAMDRKTVSKMLRKDAQEGVTKRKL